MKNVENGIHNQIKKSSATNIIIILQWKLFFTSTTRTVFEL